jgi:hypothetical protein
VFTPRTGILYFSLAIISTISFADIAHIPFMYRVGDETEARRATTAYFTFEYTPAGLSRDEAPPRDHRLYDHWRLLVDLFEALETGDQETYETITSPECFYDTTPTLAEQFKMDRIALSGVNLSEMLGLIHVPKGAVCHVGGTYTDSEEERTFAGYPILREDADNLKYCPSMQRSPSVELFSSLILSGAEIEKGEPAHGDTTANGFPWRKIQCGSPLNEAQEHPVTLHLPIARPEDNAEARVVGDFIAETWLALNAIKGDTPYEDKNHQRFLNAFHKDSIRFLPDELVAGATASIFYDVREINNLAPVVQTVSKLGDLYIVHYKNDLNRKNRTLRWFLVLREEASLKIINYNHIDWLYRLLDHPSIRNQFDQIANP